MNAKFSHKKIILVGCPGVTRGSPPLPLAMPLGNLLIANFAFDVTPVVPMSMSVSTWVYIAHKHITFNALHALVRSKHERFRMLFEFPALYLFIVCIIRVPREKIWNRLLCYYSLVWMLQNIGEMPGNFPLPGEFSPSLKRLHSIIFSSAFMSHLSARCLHYHWHNVLVEGRYWLVWSVGLTPQCGLLSLADHNLSNNAICHLCKLAHTDLVLSGTGSSLTRAGEGRQRPIAKPTF